MENINIRDSGCLRQYVYVFFFMACINHLRATPSTALALWLSFTEIRGLPGCATWAVSSTQGYAARQFLDSAEPDKPFLDK